MVCMMLTKRPSMEQPKRFSIVWPAINDGYAYPDKINKTYAGKTVLQFYSERYGAFESAEEWLQRIQNHQIVASTTGQPVEHGTILKARDGLVYSRKPWVEPEAPNYIDILYEDEHVLTLAKPVGLQVLPKGLFCQRTVLGLLQAYHEQYRRIRYPNSMPPKPVHRLGRGTSGVLLCACTVAARQKLCKDLSMSTELGVMLSTASDAASALEVPSSTSTTSTSTSSTSTNSSSAAAAERPLGKKYLALVTGVITQDEGEIDVPIGPVQYPGLSNGLFAASSGGKPSKSLYRVLHRHADSTVVEVTILTGRPHQIRIHMAALGHPLVDDPLYGVGGVPRDDVLSGSSQGAFGDADCVMPGDCGYNLHSMDLMFTHPVTGARMLITAPIPDKLRIPDQIAG